MPEVPAGVGATAIGTARARAIESARPDRLFDDPLAQRFVDAAGWPAVVEAGSAGMQAWLAIRTRWLDDFVLGAGLTQVVLVGAGLDTRAYRLAWPPGTTVWELDTEVVLSFKAAVLAGSVGAAARVPLAVDLTGDWVGPLRAAGFDPALPSTWVIEGVFAYLSADQNDTLLAGLSSVAAPGSRLAATMRAAGAPRRAASGRLAAVQEMWRSEGPEDPMGWLRGHGWSAAITGMREQSAAYGRPIGDRPSSARLVSATRL